MQIIVDFEILIYISEICIRYNRLSRRYGIIQKHYSMNESKELKRAIKMARQSVYDSAHFIGKWNGFRVYEPTFTDNEAHFIGFPQYILAKKNEMRWAEDDSESRTIMCMLVADEE